MERYFLFFVFFITSVMFGQNKKLANVNIEEFLVETQISNDADDVIEVVWWLPKIFWEISFSQDPTISQDDINEIKEMFNGLELFAVIKGKIGFFGGVTYDPIDKVIPIFSVSLDGEPFEVVDSSTVSADLSNFLIVIKPMMTNMLGPMGENIHFIFMKPNQTNSKQLIDPYKNSFLSLSIGDFRKELELPLSSLLLEKKCSEDGVLYSGKWNFCPLHGVPLMKQ